MVWLIALGAALWLITLLLPWKLWSTRERLEAESGADGDYDLSTVTVLIPARDEAEHIADTLRALACQGPGLKILVIDDESADGTAAAAATVPGVAVLAGQPLPEGWSGKLWALEQGRKQIHTPFTLLLDADIRLAPGLLTAALRKAKAEQLGLLSLMARLRMQSLAERLLMPAFVFFFKLLYPFHLSNSRNRWIAAAAGGFVLLETRALEAIGGFGVLRGAIIDDCTLAARVKAAGFRTWIGLSHAVLSQRIYAGVGPIWDMVARTAYAQLRYSPLLLLVCTLLMLLAFWVPVAGLWLAVPWTRICAIAGLAAMAACYLPTLRYYGLSPAWTLALPLAGTLFLAMTWTSALRYAAGERSRWKGRSYRIEPVGANGSPSKGAQSAPGLKVPV